MSFNFRKGHLAEEKVMKFLEDNGIDFVFEDDYFDIQAGKFKIEVKSAKILIKHGKKDPMLRMGKFRVMQGYDEKYIEGNVWICFVWTWFDDAIILGFKNAKQLEFKGKIAMQKIVPSLIQKNDFISLMKSEVQNG